jgi:formate C-acetyltransferase
MFSRIEQKTGTIISNGRMDQYMFPCYKDMDEGAHQEKAIELLECMWYPWLNSSIFTFLRPAALSTRLCPLEAVTIGGRPGTAGYHQ